MAQTPANGRHLPGYPDPSSALLLTAAIAPAPDALRAWRRWSEAGAEPLENPAALRWLPLIARNLDDAPLEAHERDLLRGARQGLWAANVRLVDAVAPAVRRLQAAGIRTMLLKGAALAYTAYDSPSLRPIGDVDVLVDPDRAQEAADLLTADGWTGLRGVAARDLPNRHAINFQRAPFGAVDLHWHMLAECCWPGADAAVWARARRLETPQLDTLVPDPADQLLHVCVHGLRWSAQASAHWLLDAALIVARAGTALDWIAVADETRRRRLTLQMATALRILQDVANVPVPPWVERDLASERASWRERLELRVKTRPRAAIRELFLTWLGRQRTARAGRIEPPSVMRLMAASVGQDWHSRLVRYALRRGRGGPS